MAETRTFADILMGVTIAKLAEHIKSEIELIHTAVSNDDELYTEESDWAYNPTITIEVKDPYTDEYNKEPRVVTAISVVEEDIILSTDEGDEFKLTDLSLEDMVKVSNCLDKSFIHLMAK